MDDFLEPHKLRWCECNAHEILDEPKPDFLTKTMKPVVNIETGEIWYMDNATKVYVYRAGCELRVGEFIWSSEGYN